MALRHMALRGAARWPKPQATESAPISHLLVYGSSRSSSTVRVLPGLERLRTVVPRPLGGAECYGSSLCGPGPQPQATESAPVGAPSFPNLWSLRGRVTLPSGPSGPVWCARRYHPVSRKVSRGESVSASHRVEMTPLTASRLPSSGLSLRPSGVGCARPSAPGQDRHESSI